MASSVKALLRHDKEQNGTYPLAIRVTKDRKVTYFHLGFTLRENQWDAAAQQAKKNYPNSARLNNLINARKAELSSTLLELETRDKDVSVKAVRQQLKPKEHGSFFKLAAQFIENMRKEGKYNRVPTEETRLKHFKEFLKGADITFAEIDVALLNRFRAYLKSIQKVGERTIINHLILIRTIYNQAISAQLIDRKNYPFGKGKITIKFPDSIKIGLTAKEVSQLERLDLSDAPYDNHARNIWLVAYYFAGMRVSDVLRLKWSDFQDDRLYYMMGKNQKAGSLKTPAKVTAILDQYRAGPPKHDLIFPELKVLEDLSDTYNAQRKISYAVKRINTALAEVAKKAEINKALTLHIARHTFGNISGDKIPVQMLQKLYRHSSITTTISYQGNFVFKDVDDALDAVLEGKL